MRAASAVIGQVGHPAFLLPQLKPFSSYDEHFSKFLMTDLITISRNEDPVRVNKESTSTPYYVAEYFAPRVVDY